MSRVRNWDVRVAVVGRGAPGFSGHWGGLLGGARKWHPQPFRGVPGPDQHPLQPAAGAGSTPKPVSPRQVSYSTSAVKEVADQVPFPAEAVNQLLMGYSNNSTCLKRREKMGI